MSTSSDAEGRPLPAWTCPVCAETNAIEANTCQVCGTPFVRLFRQEEERPKVAVGAAVTRSLIFPGLGHRLLGRGGEGLARAVLFLLTIGIPLMIVLGRGGVPSGPLLGMVAIFLVAALGLYALTAYEAARIAAGGSRIVTPRQLMWFAVGLIVLLVLMSTLIITSTVAGR